MPTINEIIQSVAVPSLIKDEFISKGKFQELSYGGYVNYAGGFTVVFPVTVNGEKWAFRCWHHDLGNLRSHFEILSEELQKLRNPYFCDFTYVDEGIVVNGLKYPTTRMRWIDGVDIKQFICEHRTEKQRLKRLASKFLEMAQTLHQQGIAHGDLQHGNILVDKNDNMFLIDYDSVYLPALKGQADIITGLKGYQHPKRSENVNASEKLDYFSELIIYTSIIGVAEKPDLVDKYNLEDAEQMLFSPKDFVDIEQSEIFWDLKELKGIFPRLLEVLKQYLSEDDINNFVSFDALMDKYYPDPKILYFEADRGNKVVVGTEGKIIWSVDNTSELYLNEESIEVYQKNYQELFSTLGTKHFSLVAKNGLKEVRAELDIEAVDGAIVSLITNTNKLRKGQREQAVLQWKIENAQSALLIYEDTEHVIGLEGNLIVSPKETTTYRISAKAKEGEKLAVQELTIFVTEASKVEFEADKVYSLPSIPIKLTWNVQFAKEARLDGENVELCGSKIVEVDRDTCYILTVVDDFGTSDHPLTVRMLPLPFVRGVMVPTPNISKNVNIVNKIPRPAFNISLVPSTEEPKFSLEVPQFVETPEILKEKEQLPTGIMRRMETVWRNFENSIIKKLKIY